MNDTNHIKSDNFNVLPGVGLQDIYEDDLPHNNVINILLIGDPGVGKSSLISRFVSDEYNSDITPTTASKTNIKYVKYGDMVYKLNIIDTRRINYDRYGGEYKQIQKSHCIVICFDITHKPSFDDIRKWINLASNVGTTGSLRIMVGCKSDMRSTNPENEISKSTAQKFCDEAYKDILYIEASAKEDIFVKDIFLYSLKYFLSNKNEFDVLQEKIEARSSCILY